MQASSLEERVDSDGGWHLPGAAWMKGAVDKLKGYGPAGGAASHDCAPLLLWQPLRVVFSRQVWLGRHYARHKCCWIDLAIDFVMTVAFPPLD